MNTSRASNTSNSPNSPNTTNASNAPSVASAANAPSSHLDPHDKSGPFNRIEHIGIAVQNLDEAVSRYEQTMGCPCYKREVVESEGVETAFFRAGESKIELLAAVRSDSPIARFLEKRGEGMHHVAFGVDDIRREMERCRSLGYTLLNETPKPGADNKLVAFLHPKEHNGVLIELCQDR